MSMIFKKNVDGQLLNRFYSHSRLVDRNIDELIGICKGVLADGAVVQTEAQFLLSWLETNRHAADKWPANLLYGRLEDALIDGVLDENEEKELIQLLMDITGKPGIDLRSTSTTLPLDDPKPDVVFNKRAFCITGKFITGTRDQVNETIMDRGGVLNSNPIKKTDYLVIGEIGSRDWIHSSFGRKIEKALELKKHGNPIRIVSEEHWIQFI